MKNNLTAIPKDGLAGLKQNWRSDAIAGFLVFLIAMPLCLAISKASGFPPIGGIYTAIIGGMLVSFFMGARLTIKGPAAGLIAIAVGAVEELGHGDINKGYPLTLAIIVIAAIIQVLFGVFKAGKLGDLFPSSAVHGMLAAIGIIIIAKQTPVLLGVQPLSREPLELIAEIPRMIATLDPEVTFIGSISLLVLFTWPLLKNPTLRIIPPSLIVLTLAIPLASYYDFTHEHDYSIGHINYHIIPGNLLVQLPDSFWGGMKLPDFSEIFSWASIKYIIMFALVGSLESILSSKAIDTLDPYKRKSNLDQDMLSVGLGNLIAGMIGGLPMISEIVRSSANINNGAKTRWSNFFHGFFLLVFVTLAADLIQMIPNAALAAMLIYTGYLLASPKEFQKTWSIGWDQLLVFLATILATLATDLLIGIFVGVILQILLNIMHGASWKTLFRANFDIKLENEKYVITIREAAVFSNYLSFKRGLDQIKPGKHVVFDFAEARTIDHTILEHLHHFEEDYHQKGGHVHITGMGKHKAHSDHPLSSRSIIFRRSNRIAFKLTKRQIALRDYAEEKDYTFYPTILKNAAKFRDFPIQRRARIHSEENILTKYLEVGKMEISDITLSQGAGIAQSDKKITILYSSDLELTIPEFSLEPEHLGTLISELSSGKDIDFQEYPVFSKKYYLRAQDEQAIRQFFTNDLIVFLEQKEAIHIESYKNKLLLYKEHDLLELAQIEELTNFCELFIKVLRAITSGYRSPLTEN